MGSGRAVSIRDLKVAFKARIVLVPIRVGANFKLCTNASGLACGAVLMQEDKPLEFFSRKFSPVEQRYSAHERERH